MSAFSLSLFFSIYCFYASGTHMLSQLYQFLITFFVKIANKSFYKASIISIRLKQSELQKSNFEAQKLHQLNLCNSYNKLKKIIYY